MEERMDKRKRFYVGEKNKTREMFSYAETPTKKTHPQYQAVVGPFKTKRAAEYLVDNPHISSVREAEKAENELRPVA